MLPVVDTLQAANPPSGRVPCSYKMWKILKQVICFLSDLLVFWLLMLRLWSDYTSVHPFFFISFCLRHVARANRFHPPLHMRYANPLMNTVSLLKAVFWSPPWAVGFHTRHLNNCHVDEKYLNAALLHGPWGCDPFYLSKQHCETDQAGQSKDPAKTFFLPWGGWHPRHRKALRPSLQLKQ